MPRILDCMVCEQRNGESFYRTDNHVFERPVRLVDAIVRRCHAEKLSHPKFRQLDLVLSPDFEPKLIQIEGSKPSRARINCGLDPSWFNSLESLQRDKHLAGLILESFLMLFLPTSAEANLIQSIGVEFERYYAEQLIELECRRKSNSKFDVAVTYTINWGDTPPFYVAHVSIKSLDQESTLRRTSFKLNGTENDIFDLAGKIAVKNGEIVLHPRPARLYLLEKYQTPLVFKVDDMPLIEKASG